MTAGPMGGMSAMYGAARGAQPQGTMMAGGGLPPNIGQQMAQLQQMYGGGAPAAGGTMGAALGMPAGGGLAGAGYGAPMGAALGGLAGAGYGQPPGAPQPGAPPWVAARQAMAGGAPRPMPGPGPGPGGPGAPMPTPGPGPAPPGGRGGGYWGQQRPMMPSSVGMPSWVTGR